MSVPEPPGHRTTLLFTTTLHGFTHAFGAMLVPLYLLMVADLHLHGVKAASFIVTLSGIVYCLGSYPAGVLADRFNRKWLLGIGLIGHALAMILMGLSRQYEMLIVLGVVSGLFGTLYHPAANALIPAHYPKNPGLAIGVLGIGSGIGFFLGPQYAGWRAESATWHFGSIADWQRPLIELGAVGLLVGIAFLVFAREVRRRSHDETAIMPARIASEEIVLEYEPHPPHVHLTKSIRYRVLAIASILGLRDFAGVASLSIASLYLQKAHSYTPRQAGFTVGAMMLISVLVNPIAVTISQGRRRLPTLSIMLVLGGLVLATVPFFPIDFFLPALCLFQSFQLGSYAVSDAAMLERVAPEIRGRVIGLFLTLAGTFASTAPFFMGWSVDLLRDHASIPRAYVPIFATLAVMMVISAFASPLITRLTTHAPRESKSQAIAAAGRVTNPIAGGI